MKSAFVLAAVLLMGAPAIALAHAHATTYPADKAVLKQLHDVQIVFSEPVKTAFTGAILTSADGHAVKTGKPDFAADKLKLTLPVTGALKPGAYTVKWHAVAADTHRSEGAFGFTVEP
ncbi:copper homeostasis periplasmic binding protein CopC [soil metagenome]